MRRMAAALLLVLLGATAHADAISGSRTSVAGWFLSAYDDDGKFTHCALAATYNSGITMFFAISEDYSWRVGWAHSSWNFRKGQKIEIALQVDGKGPYWVTATASDKEMALAELPSNGPLFGLLRTGNRLTVNANGNRYDFNLTGTYAALAEVVKCVSRYSTGSVPPSSGTASSASPTPPSVPQKGALTAEQPKAEPQAIDRSGKTPAIKLTLSDGTELRPREAFERSAGAIYVVKVGGRLGSAVAVSENDLLTNCHVVRNASTLTLEREGATTLAVVVSANSDADRCVLRTTRSMPKWVKVRPYADVKVGERVYSIGAPRGLELSLADGLVSSKRISDGERLIQTTAPISPGSSGGGLFDAQGNLIGITTFLLKDAQNLNFAIAAEEYAK